MDVERLHTPVVLRLLLLTAAVALTLGSTSSCTQDLPEGPCTVTYIGYGTPRGWFGDESWVVLHFEDGRFLRAEELDEVSVWAEYGEDGRLSRFAARWQREYETVWDEDRLVELRGLDDTPSLFFEYEDGLLARYFDLQLDNRLSYEGRVVSEEEWDWDPGMFGGTEYAFEEVGQGLGTRDCLSRREAWSEEQEEDRRSFSEDYTVSADGLPQVFVASGNSDGRWRYEGAGCEHLGLGLPEFPGYPFWLLRYGIPTPVCY